jgi:putative aldouronate transport system substrate-binding protein
MRLGKRAALVAVIVVALAGMAWASAGSGESAAAQVPQELTIGTFDNWYTPASYTANLPIFQEIEKKTGIKIKWDVVPPSQYSTAMQTRMAAGKEGLPDIINIPGDPVRWGQDGIIIPMEGLIEKAAPNTKKYFAQNPEVAALNVAPDGHVYKISSVVMGSTFINPFAWILRMDWLQKLNLKEPDTTDDWYKILKAFKTQDPNGNGKADEIPMIPQNTWFYLLRWGESWGLKFIYSSGFSVKNGKVGYDYLDPKAKEVFTALNKLYTEGLIDPEIMSYSSDMHFAKVSRNIVGSALHFISNIAQYENNLAKAGFTGAKYKGMPPAKGPYGDRLMEGYGPISGNFGISANCKNPELAMKWLDYVYASKAGSDYVMFGIEGKSYNRDAAGKVKLTDYVLKNPDGMGTFDALRALGSWPNVPYIQTEEAYVALFTPFPDLLDTAAKCKPYIMTGFPPILPTAKESEDQTAVMGDLNTYRDEMVSKFIIGQTPLSEFDNFVKQLRSLGIDKVLAIRQAQYDRFNEALKKMK